MGLGEGRDGCTTYLTDMEIHFVVSEWNILCLNIFIKYKCMAFSSLMHGVSKHREYIMALMSTQHTLR